MNHNHRKDICECGVVLLQCKCMDQNKTINIIPHEDHASNLHGSNIELKIEKSEDKVAVIGIPISIDFNDDLENVIGYLIPNTNINPKAELLYKLLKEGYTFEIGGSVSDGELMSVSILTRTAKRDINL